MAGGDFEDGQAVWWRPRSARQSLVSGLQVIAVGGRHGAFSTQRRFDNDDFEEWTP
ncbi:MAG: hypothetical protein V2A73_21190 [Pseudomonadota bacterium]